MSRNKHGLSRYIPSQIRLQVRQECGFDRVNCGLGIFDYEHFNPDFKDAIEHDAASIALLCLRCHGKGSRRHLSKNTIETKRRNPKCLESGFTREEFEVGTATPYVCIGTSRYLDSPIILRIDDEDLLWIRAPESPDMPFLITGDIYNSNSEHIFSICDNEWRGDITNWDIEVVGPTITIRRDRGAIALQLTTIAGEGIIIDRMDMYYQGKRVIVFG